MKLKLLLVMICVLFIGSGYEQVYAQTRNIFGASVDISVPPLPTGGCVSGTFNISIVGTTTIATIDAGTNASMKDGPFESGNKGIGYVAAVNLAANAIQLVTMDLSTNPASLITNASINAGNVPDSPNQVNGVFYDSTRASGKYVFLSESGSGTCAVSACVHFRSYNGITNIVDTLTTTPNNTAGVIVSTVDSAGVSYASYNNATNNVVGKFNSAFALVGTTAAYTNAVSSLIAGNDGFVYGTVIVAGVLNITKIDTSTLAVVNTVIAGTNGGTGIGYAGGFIYVGVTTGANTKIQKYRVSDMAFQTEVVITATAIVLTSGINIDTTNNKLYVVTSDAGAMQWRRLTISSLAVEQQVGLAFVPYAVGVGVDFIHQRLHQTSKNGSNQLQVTTVSLCS